MNDHVINIMTDVASKLVETLIDNHYDFKCACKTARDAIKGAWPGYRAEADYVMEVILMNYSHEFVKCDYL